MQKQIHSHSFICLDMTRTLFASTTIPPKKINVKHRKPCMEMENAELKKVKQFWFLSIIQSDNHLALIRNIQKTLDSTIKQQHN